MGASPDGTTAVEVERRAALLLLTLNGPSSRNAIGPSVYPQIQAQIISAVSDPIIRVVVLSRTDSFFSSGGNIRALQDSAKSTLADATSNTDKRCVRVRRAKWSCRRVCSAGRCPQKSSSPWEPSMYWRPITTRCAKLLHSLKESPVGRRKPSVPSNNSLTPLSKPTSHPDREAPAINLVRFGQGAAEGKSALLAKRRPDFGPARLNGEMQEKVDP